MGHSVADLVAECARLQPEFAELRARAASLDHFYLSTRYPSSLPGGIPAGGPASTTSTSSGMVNSSAKPAPQA